MYRMLIAAAFLIGIALAFDAATAKEKTPNATIELTGKSVAAGVGVSWGSGTLTYNGKTYPVSITGIDIGDVGVTTVTATGKVYDLKKLEDFDGNYASVGAGATLGGGADTVAMKNQHGVRVDIVSTTQGIKLALATGGASLKIER
jgi:hypothetical protein